MEKQEFAYLVDQLFVSLGELGKLWELKKNWSIKRVPRVGQR
jgi:hypothetical protein